MQHFCFVLCGYFLVLVLRYHLLLLFQLFCHTYIFRLRWKMDWQTIKDFSLLFYTVFVTKILCLRESMQQLYTINETGIMLHSLPVETLELRMAWVDNSFRVCVCGSETDEVIFFRHYSFLQTHSFSDALADLKAIVATDVLFSGKFRSVKIGVSGRMELTPQQYYKVEENTVTGELQNGQIIGSLAFETTQQEFYNAFFSNIIIELLPLKWLDIVFPQGSAEKLFVQIDGNLLHIAYFRALDKLQFYNSFEFRTAEDFAYFTNLVTESLGLKRTETELVLSGDVAQPSKIYDMAFTYFQNVSFLHNTKLIYSALFSTYPKHQNIALFSM